MWVDEQKKFGLKGNPVSIFRNSIRQTTKVGAKGPHFFQWTVRCPQPDPNK